MTLARLAQTIVAVSALIQIAAGLQSLRLIPVSGRKLAWSLIATALFGMAGRRLMSLAALLSNGHPTVTTLEYELLGLTTSALMLVGVTYIAPIFNELNDANDKLKDALGKVKVLGGLIPICASCKKIRDDKGYWTQLEQYLSEHTQADFTHGYCPHCQKKLLEEMEAYRREESRGALPESPKT